MSYGTNVLIAIDQLANTVFKGWPDETLSSRAYRWHTEGKRSWPMRLIDTLFFWQVGHCESSYRSEAARNHLPRILRM